MNSATQYNQDHPQQIPLTFKMFKRHASNNSIKIHIALNPTYAALERLELALSTEQTNSQYDQTILLQPNSKMTKTIHAKRENLAGN
jgi:hypothetical protein